MGDSEAGQELSSPRMILFLFGLFGWAQVSARVLGLLEGDSCTTLGGGQGVCRLLSKCETAGDYKNNHPPICGFIGMGFEPIICCPEKQLAKTRPGLKVEKICQDLANLWIFNPRDPITLRGFIPPQECCGTCSGIAYSLNSSPSKPRGHPYMALIGFCSTEKTSCGEKEVVWGCGGTLVTPRYVLSAAHCAYLDHLGPAKWARLGDLDISSSKDDAMPVNKTIVDRIVHPKYQKEHVYHDIALFKLDSEVELNGYVHPVCLNTDRHVSEKKATFAGWGTTNLSSGMSSQLLQGAVDIYNDTECKRVMFDCEGCKDRTRAPLGHQPELFFCAGLPDGSMDTCPGDSGGPLVIHESSNIQIGITAFGKECSMRKDTPGGYTRVSNYIPWIEEVAFKDLQGHNRRHERHGHGRHVYGKTVKESDEGPPFLNQQNTQCPGRGAAGHYSLMPKMST